VGRQSALGGFGGSLSELEVCLFAPCAEWVVMGTGTRLVYRPLRVTIDDCVSFKLYAIEVGLPMSTRWTNQQQVRSSSLRQKSVEAFPPSDEDDPFVAHRQDTAALVSKAR